MINNSNSNNNKYSNNDESNNEGPPDDRIPNKRGFDVLRAKGGNTFKRSDITRASVCLGAVGVGLSIGRAPGRENWRLFEPSTSSADHNAINVNVSSNIHRRICNNNNDRDDNLDHDVEDFENIEDIEVIPHPNRCKSNKPILIKKKIIICIIYNSKNH